MPSSDSLGPLSLKPMLALTAILMLSSCGPAGIPTVPVKGKVTLAGGEWPRPATFDFTTVRAAEGMPMRPDTAVVQGDGRFEMQLVPGEYVVNITCWEVEPPPDNPAKGKSYVPDSYAKGEQRKRIDVPLGAKGPIEVNWDIPRQ